MEKKKKYTLIAGSAVAAILIIFLIVQIVSQKMLVSDGVEYLEKKEYEKAYESFDKAEHKYTLFTSKKNILYYKGESLVFLGRYQDAANAYDAIGEEVRAQALEGFCYQQDGKKKEAEACYEEAINTDKNDGTGYYYLYAYYIEEGDYEKAMETLEAAEKAELHTMKKEIAFAKIVVCEKALDYKKALEYADAFVKAYPDDEAGKREQEFLKTR